MRQRCAPPRPEEPAFHPWHGDRSIACMTPLSLHLHHPESLKPSSWPARERSSGNATEQRAAWHRVSRRGCVPNHIQTHLVFDLLRLAPCWRWMGPRGRGRRRGGTARRKGSGRNHSRRWRCFRPLCGEGAWAALPQKGEWPMRDTGRGCTQPRPLRRCEHRLSSGEIHGIFASPMAAVGAPIAGQMLFGLECCWLPRVLTRGSVPSAKIRRASEKTRPLAGRLDRGRCSGGPSCSWRSCSPEA